MRVHCLTERFRVSRRGSRIEDYGEYEKYSNTFLSLLKVLNHFDGHRAFSRNYKNSSYGDYGTSNADTTCMYITDCLLIDNCIHKYFWKN